jgi:hypothetical protein
MSCINSKVDRGQRPKDAFDHQNSGALFLKLGKIQILNFEKNKQKYQSVAYDLFYLCVNLYYKISCILASEKITKFQI